MKEHRLVFKMQDGSLHFQTFSDPVKRTELMGMIAGGWTKWYQDRDGIYLNADHIVWMEPVDVSGD